MTCPKHVVAVVVVVAVVAVSTKVTVEEYLEERTMDQTLK
jgi:hypothetical protein